MRPPSDRISFLMLICSMCTLFRLKWSLPFSDLNEVCPRKFSWTLNFEVCCLTNTKGLILLPIGFHLLQQRFKFSATLALSISLSGVLPGGLLFSCSNSFNFGVPSMFTFKIATFIVLAIICPVTRTHNFYHLSIFIKTHVWTLKRSKMFPKLQLLTLLKQSPRLISGRSQFQADFLPYCPWFCNEYFV